MSAKIKEVTEKVYQMGNHHIAGQHSLTGGELVCVAIAAAMIFAPAMFKQIPLVGKYASATAAFVVLVLALIIW